jgi:flagellar biosynthesis component FlhA
MLGRISIVIMFLSNPGAGSVAEGSSCSDGPVAVVFVVVVLVVDVVACVIDVVWPFWSLSLVCLLLSLFHGQIIRASTRICDPSYFKLLHF